MLVKHSTFVAALCHAFKPPDVETALECFVLVGAEVPGHDTAREFLLVTDTKGRATRKPPNDTFVAIILAFLQHHMQLEREVDSPASLRLFQSGEVGFIDCSSHAIPDLPSGRAHDGGHCGRGLAWRWFFEGVAFGLVGRIAFEGHGQATGASWKSTALFGWRSLRRTSRSRWQATVAFHLKLAVGVHLLVSQHDCKPGSQMPECYGRSSKVVQGRNGESGATETFATPSFNGSEHPTF